MRKIRDLSKETGESVESVVERAITLYGKRVKTKTASQGGDRLDRLLLDPGKREAFEEVTAALRERSHTKLTAEQRKARASAGAKGRNEKLNQEARSKIAKTAATARWEKNKMTPNTESE